MRHMASCMHHMASNSCQVHTEAHQHLSSQPVHISFRCAAEMPQLCLFSFDLAALSGKRAATGFKDIPAGASALWLWLRSGAQMVQLHAKGCKGTPGGAGV